LVPASCFREKFRALQLSTFATQSAKSRREQVQQKTKTHSIILSARASNVEDTSRLSVPAVSALMRLI
jgi:hypothetical protein